MNHHEDKIDGGRRAFFGVAAGVSAGLVAPGVVLHAVSAAPRSEPVTDAVRWGLLIDTTKCADGCRACVDACDQENGLDLQSKPEGQSEAQWGPGLVLRALVYSGHQLMDASRWAPGCPPPLL